MAALSEYGRNPSINLHPFEGLRPRTSKTLVPVVLKLARSAQVNGIHRGGFSGYGTKTTSRSNR
jgi:hypothetical protein